MNHGLVAPAAPRVAVRIRRLLVACAVTISALFTGGAWLLLLEVEDAAQDSYLAPLLAQVARSPVPPPPWIARFASAAAVAERHDLAPVPEAAGLHEFFAADDGRHALVVDRFATRLRLWLGGDREREYRLWVEPAGAAGPAVWLVADLDRRELTESGPGRLHLLLAALGAALVASALLASRVITRWALRPVLALAERVRTREAAVADGGAAAPCAAGLPDDEIGYLARTLDAYHARLRDTVERERRFLADCSHELRTPAATIHGAVALLRETPDASTLARTLPRLERAGARLRRVIETFLFLARAGPAAPAAPIALGPLVTEVLAEWRALHAAHPLRVEFAVEGEPFAAAPGEIVAILCHNLVGNAYAHLAGGHLRVTAAADAAGARLRFEDDGPGLPEFSAPESAAVPPPGHGLGLPLVERLCALHGWRFAKGPRPGGGTRFEIRFGPGRDA
jgi:signal transduction histidine kinase